MIWTGKTSGDASPHLSIPDQKGWKLCQYKVKRYKQVKKKNSNFQQLHES